MFLRNFVKKGLLEAVGEMPDYWVILNATGWLEKGVLQEEDLVEINNAIEEKNTVVEPVIEEPTVETENSEALIEEPVENVEESPEPTEQEPVGEE